MQGLTQDLIAIGISTVLCFVLLPRPQRSWQRAKRFAFLAAIWLPGAVVVVFGLFPAMWVDPLGVLRRLFGMSGSYFDAPVHVHFFRGLVTADPGPLFYPLALLFRVTPIVLIGLVASLVPLLAGSGGSGTSAAGVSGSGGMGGTSRPDSPPQPPSRTRNHAESHPRTT